MAFDLKSFDIKKVKYEINVGSKDQNIRYIGGAVLLGASVFLGSVPLLILGGLLVVTAFTRWCPAYSAFQHNTLCSEAAPPCSGTCHGHTEAEVAAPAPEAPAEQAPAAEAPKEETAAAAPAEEEKSGESAGEKQE